jgi:hypothetical protein
MFQRRISSSDMFGDSISDYFRKNETKRPSQTDFWVNSGLLDEFDPMKVK